MPTTIAESKPVRARRLAALPPFLFDEIDRKRRERLAAGADVVNLGVGDPDRPTPAFIVNAMAESMRTLSNQQYPAVGGGLKVFREAAANFMKRRFGVSVDPMRHIIALLGSKDGIAHLPMAVTNPGDIVVVPEPAYPVYEIGSLLAGCAVKRVPLRHDANWVMDFGAIDVDQPRICWINYPGNPTAASATTSDFERALRWCEDRGAILASDLAYSELYLGADPCTTLRSAPTAARPPSVWEAPGADIERSPAIEFHSLSKTFNMTGWRIGFAVGRADLIAALQEYKSNVDSGTFNAIQEAGAVALHHFDHADVAAMRALYRERRDLVVSGLRRIGCQVDSPAASFFVWARCPRDERGDIMDSFTFGERCLSRADVVIVPGGGFGPSGAQWFRVALSSPIERIRLGMERLASAFASQD